MLDGKTQQITHQTGTIVSHRGYSHEDYPHNVDGTLGIGIDGILLFTFTVNGFELESITGRFWSLCNDYLKIKGQTYCGTHLASNTRATFVSATGELSIMFHTAEYTSRDEDFLLQYTKGVLNLSNQTL